MILEYYYDVLLCLNLTEVTSENLIEINRKIKQPYMISHTIYKNCSKKEFYKA